MRIIAAADHGGVELKDKLVKLLRENGHEVEDIGTNGTESVDYPEYAETAARKVASGEFKKGILVCGTGIGMSIAANKVKGVRCARVVNGEDGRLAAEHNVANMIALGGRTTSFEDAWDAVQAWLSTQPGGERHQRRVGMIEKMES